MPRYFLNLRNANGLTQDPEGAEYLDTDAAREDAVASAREIMADRLREGEAPNGDCFEIADETGRTVLTVPFHEAMWKG